MSDDGSVGRDLSNDLTRNYDLEGACYQNDGLLRSPRNQGLVHKQRVHAPGLECLMVSIYFIYMFSVQVFYVLALSKK